MTSTRAKELLPVIQAFAEGKVIQVWDIDRWSDTSEPGFLDGFEYRVKPPPRDFWISIETRHVWVKEPTGDSNLIHVREVLD